MNIIQLLQDFNVPFSTEGKNVSAGWIGLQCPFCADESNHLGYNLDGNYFVCWKCNSHGLITTLSKLLHLSEKEVREIVKKYGLFATKLAKEPIVRIRAKAHKLPSNTVPLQSNHKRYLESRGFDPDFLEKQWNLLGTGPISKLGNIDYKHRIIIPFIWDGQQVSFDSRDITGKAINRYQACPKDRELIPHKSILYGKQEKWTNKCILVEGPTDVWRFGLNSCAVSGIKYTPSQVRWLGKTFRQIAVCFDADPQARIQADKIVAELKFRGVDAFRVDIEGDPGGMKQSDADYLVKQLMK